MFSRPPPPPRPLRQAPAGRRAGGAGRGRDRRRGPAAPGAAPGGRRRAVPATPAGSQLDRDRLVACAPLVARLAPRDRLAQRLVSGSTPADPDAVVATVRATQVGGIFLGGNATALLQTRRCAGCRPSPGSRSPCRSTTRAAACSGSTRWTGLPSARRDGHRMPVDQVRDLARRARAASSPTRGVTVDFAPVVDVGDQPAARHGGPLPLGPTPPLAAALRRGLRPTGCATRASCRCSSTSPGHGHANGDSHQAG